MPEDVPIASSSTSTIPQIRIVLCAPRAKRRATVHRRWHKTDIPKEDVDRFIWKDPSTNADKLPQSMDGIFNLFFDDDVIEMIVQETIRHAGSKGYHSFVTSPQEIRVFMAILLVSGFSQVPRRRLYWSRDADV